MMKQLKIGNVTLPNRYILGPMAGVTDLPFRVLCKEQGAGLLCMEMISAKALRYKNKNTKALLAIDPREYPVSLQLFGEDPDIISEQATSISDPGYQYGLSGSKGRAQWRRFGVDEGSEANL
jgi:tRNA-dihydrouridine synthase B